LTGSNVELDRELARRWSWNERIRSFTTIDTVAIVRSLACLDIEAIAVWDRGWDDGLYTWGEVASLVYTRIDHPFDVAPDPYIERFGELRRLDTMFLHHPGVVLIGREGSGRTALSRAWRARRRCTTGEIIDEARLVITTPEDLESARVCDPSQQYGAMELPPIRDEERIPIWLCATRAEDALARILTVFAESRRTILDTPWFPFTTDGISAGWMTPQPDDVETIAPPTWVKRSIASGAWTPPNNRRWRSIDQYLPGGRLDDLIELERQLST
jgi:hypothetical protein